MSNISPRTILSNVRADLYVPTARTVIFKNSTAVNGAQIWSGLDLVIRNLNSVFNRAYMNYVFNQTTVTHNAMNFFTKRFVIFINAIYPVL